MTVVPAANSEEGFRRAAGDDTDPAARSYANRATAEWAYEAAGDEHFDTANDLLNAPDEDGSETEEARHREKGEALLRSMVVGLRLLDAEGLFGTGKEREKVTLFGSVSDSDEAGETETSSARQLDSSGAGAAFAR